MGLRLRPLCAGSLVTICAVLAMLAAGGCPREQTSQTQGTEDPAVGTAGNGNAAAPAANPADNAGQAGQRAQAAPGGVQQGGGGGAPAGNAGANGAPGQNANPGGNPPAQPQIAGDDERAFIEALAIGGRETFSAGRASIPEVVVGVFDASNIAGAWVANGTVAIGLPGGTQYAPTPADRLVVQTPDHTAEYFITSFTGDLSGITAFINNHSDLRFRVVIQNKCDLQVTGAQAGANFQNHYVGSIVLPRGTAQADITHGGGSSFSLGANFLPDFSVELVTDPVTGVSLVSGDSIAGTVSAAGGTINVSEVFDDKIVNTVQQQKLWIATSGARNGVNYRSHDAFFRFVERDGYVSEPDFWRGQGQLLRDGAPIGEYKWDSGIFLSFAPPPRVLELVDGTKIGV